MNQGAQWVTVELEDSHKHAQQSGVPRSLMYFILSICFFCILADGYDLGIYGAVLPSLLDYQPWGLSPAHAGTIGSYALFGMLFGAIFVGSVTDLIGRKKTLIICVALFSVTMILCAIATSPTMFAIFRFIGGIGLGGVIPTASALAIEYSPPHRRSFNYALMFSGYSFGTVLAAILAILLLDSLGWRFMFWIGAIPLLLIPIMMKYLPESVSFLLSRGNVNEAEAICKRYKMDISQFENLREIHANEKGKSQKSIKGLFSKQYIRATLAIFLTYIMGFYLVYGLNTWLPQIMRELGYSLHSSLSFLLVMNLTAGIGALFASAIADRWGSKRVIGVSYALAALSAFLLTIGVPSMAAVYLLVGLAGFGAVGSTQIMNAFVTKYYPAESRATAIGWGLGIGRIGAISGPVIIGLLLSMNFDLIWSFYTFVIAGIVATIGVALIPNKKGEIV
ncbi:AAHS family benzoate transporter-like MFS transporter [Bacillus thermophilus]|uniref:AAHS family benzoate transporter-like MFS transporter n=2 Tax=Siminovitchia thermophila TaxID=1245522 RepID=A0ABS2R628_9BACI|nr:AAHS family benzoate transporter-like MFS transporter [Siminovitchia thermophila]